MDYVKIRAAVLQQNKKKCLKCFKTLYCIALGRIGDYTIALNGTYKVYNKKMG